MKILTKNNLVRLLGVVSFGLVLSCAPGDDGSSLSGMDNCGGTETLPDPDGIYKWTKKDTPKGGIKVEDADTGRTAYIGANGVRIPLILEEGVITNLHLVDDAPCIYMQVTSSNAVLYEDKYVSRSIGKVGVRMPVIRELTETLGNGVVVMRVNIRGGALSNTTGWMRAENLAVRNDPSLCGSSKEASTTSGTNSAANRGSDTVLANVRYGSLTGKNVYIDKKWLENRTVTIEQPKCSVEHLDYNNPVDYLGNKERGLPMELVQSTILCAVGLGEGFGKAVKDTASGLFSLVKLTPKLAKEVAKRRWREIRAITGSRQAMQEIIQSYKNDADRVKAFGGLMLNALPAIDAYMDAWYEGYRQLNPQQQSRILCKILGSLSLEALTSVSAVNLAKKAMVTKFAKPIAKIDNVIAQADNIPPIKKTLEAIADVSRYIDEIGVPFKENLMGLKRDAYGWFANQFELRHYDAIIKEFGEIPAFRSYKPGEALKLNPKSGKIFASEGGGSGWYLFILDEGGNVHVVPNVAITDPNYFVSKVYHYTKEDLAKRPVEMIKHAFMAEYLAKKVGKQKAGVLLGGEFIFKDGVWHANYRSGRFGHGAGRTFGGEPRNKESLQKMLDMMNESGTSKGLKIKNCGTDSFC